MKQADLTEPITRAQKNDRTRRRWIFAAGGLVGLCLILVFCSAGGFLAFRWFGHPGESTSNLASSVPVPAEFASLGSLASVPSNPQSFNVDKNAHLLKLGSGMSLQVPAGAFSSPNQLLLTEVNVAFDKISFEVKQSPFYVLSPRDEVGTLGTPLILEISIPSGDVMVVQYDGQNWQAVVGTAGQTVQLKITHFSNWLWGYVEGRSEEDLKENLSQNPALNIPLIRSRTLIENGDALTRTFFGVGEAAEQSQDQMCSEIMDVLEQYNTPKNREFPEGSTALNLDLAPFLFDGKTPESSGGYYFNVTEASLDTINDTVLASTTPLSPADVLKISIDANDGNIPLGVLAAHNYLKQIKYQGIYDFKFGQPFPPDQGLPASHLASWREDSNITPAGEYDKMGPLYHIFAAMTAGIWFPTRLGGDIAVNGEAMLRSFQLLKDNPDLQKAAADACGDNAAVWLRDHAATNQVVTAKQPPATTEVDRNYTGQISVKFYLDPADNTWKCDESALFTYTFTLHFYTDGSIMMDNNNFDDKAIAGAFHFQPDSSTPGKFIGSDPSSADTMLLFPDGSNGDMSKLTYISILNEPDGNPGTCSFDYTQTTSNP